MGVTIGIDLGTSNSCAAFHDGTQVSVLSTPEGSRVLPSVVSFRDGERLVGVPARQNASAAPDDTIIGIKRLMGQPFLPNEDQGALVVETDGGELGVRTPEGVKTPVEVSAWILGALKAMADESLADPVDGAVVTVPAYFDPAARQATRDAALRAGFKRVDLLDEPMAAAIAYGLNRAKFQTVLVYDFGGGTFDVAIMEVGRNHFQTLATNGNLHLGGLDFDARIVELVTSRFRVDHGIDLTLKQTAMLRLQRAAEEAKIALSGLARTSLQAPFVAYTDDGQPLNVQHEIDRVVFEEATRVLVDETVEITQRALREANLTAAEIDSVLLVGGMTRVPAVRSAVRALFDREPLQRINPDEIVAMGAAIVAAIKDGRLPDVSRTETLSHTVSIEVDGGALVPIIPRGTEYPCAETREVRSVVDDQEVFALRVYQGPRTTPLAADEVARLDVPLAPLPGGDARAFVTVRVDQAGVVSVEAEHADADI